MSNIAQRGGSVRVRTGGNTQEFAYFVDEIPDANGKSVGKELVDNTNPVSNPLIELVCPVLIL